MLSGVYDQVRKTTTILASRAGIVVVLCLEASGQIRIVAGAENRCSKDQVLPYFRRFDPNTAHILAPDSLRDRLARFFADGNTVYNHSTDNKEN